MKSLAVLNVFAVVAATALAAVPGVALAQSNPDARTTDAARNRPCSDPWVSLATKAVNGATDPLKCSIYLYNNGRWNSYAELVQAVRAANLQNIFFRLIPITNTRDKTMGVFDGATLVAAGGESMVAAGGGNIVAAGGGNITYFIRDNKMVAAGGGNLVSPGGGNVVPEIVDIPMSAYSLMAGTRWRKTALRRK